MHDEYPIDQLCATLAVARSGYHAWAGRLPGPRVQANLALLPLIAQAHRESRQTYGSPRVQHWLQQHGQQCGRHRVARLMRSVGLRSQSRRRFRPLSLTDSHHDLPIAPNRLRDAVPPTRREAVWEHGRPSLNGLKSFTTARGSTAPSASNPLWTLKPTSTKNTHASCTHTLSTQSGQGQL